MMSIRSLFVLPFLAIVVTSPFVSGAEPEDITFIATIDQTEQRYVRILPAEYSRDARHDVLIALHGHGSDRWQYIKEGRGECKSARDAATKHRMIFISPDYRARTSWMGPRAEADLVQIIADLKKQHTIGRVF